MYHLHEKGTKVNRTERSTQTPSSRTGFFAALRAVPAAMLVLGAVGMVLPTAGQAAQSHAFAGFFGSPGSGADQLELTAESGLAVDQSTGDVYVGDTGNHRVDEFSASGAFIDAFGWGVLDGTAESQTCTTTCRPGLSGSGPGQFENPKFIAVDNTPDGAGDLYVADSGSHANERQTVTVGGASAGSYTLSYTAPIHDATTTAGSVVVTGALGPVGRSGDPVSGPGIPAGATFVKRLSESTFELSAPATATAAHVVLGITETTASIAPKATAEELHAALASLPALELGTVGLGSVCVSGSAGGPYTVEFCTLLAATDVPQMTCNASGLSPSGATCTVATTVEGKDTSRAQKFGPAGNLLAAWGGTPSGGERDGYCPSCNYFSHFELPDGVGVKPEGTLLVSQTSFREVLGFAGELTEWTQSSGEFVGQSGVGEGPIGIALDPAGRFYSGRGSSPPYEVSQSSYVEGAYHENFTLDHGPATGVAVDPATEDVYVAHYNPTGHHSDVAAYDSAANKLESPFGANGEITEAGMIAASGFSGSAGDVYVADKGAGRVEIFAPGGPRADLTVARSGTGLGSVVSEPAGISCPSLCSAGFPENETVVLTAVPPEHATFVGWSGDGCSGAGPCTLTLAAATTVTAVFAQNRPALTAGPVSNVTRHTATLTGAVDPEGDASSCRFEYGPTSAYGAEAPCLTDPGSGVSPVAVSAELWDLTADGTYHYRVVSANTGGVAYGPDQTFTTLAEGCGADAALCPAPPVVALLAPAAVVSAEPVVLPPRARALTDAQRLAKALKACGKKKGSKRTACEKTAHKKYGPVKTKRKQSKKSTLNRQRG